MAAILSLPNLVVSQPLGSTIKWVTFRQLYIGLWTALYFWGGYPRFFFSFGLLSVDAWWYGEAPEHSDCRAILFLFLHLRSSCLLCQQECIFAWQQSIGGSGDTLVTTLWSKQQIFIDPPAQGNVITNLLDVVLAAEDGHHLNHGNGETLPEMFVHFSRQEVRFYIFPIVTPCLLFFAV